MREREPIFNVPAVVLGVLGLLAAIHAARMLLTPDQDLELIYAFAFIPARYAGNASAFPGGDTAAGTSFITHMLLHGDILHLAFNSAWLLAFGGAIAKRTGALRFIGFTLFTGIAGALTFLIFNPGLDVPMIGASGAVAGMMGGSMRFFFSALDEGGFRLLAEHPDRVRLMPLGEALLDRRVQFATAALVLVNGLAVFGLAGTEAPGGIAWEAHLGGYLAGLLGFGLFDRPSVSAEQPFGD